MLPVHIITGFLGSGKTTLLQNLLQDKNLSNSAILVNEFGEIAIDHLILENVSESTVLLNNGCICCSILSSLSDALVDLLSKRDRGELPKFERVIIETTGLAEPAPIISTLSSSPIVRQHFKKASVTTVIDLSSTLKATHTQDIWTAQVAASDFIFYSKWDIAQKSLRDSILSLTTKIIGSASTLRTTDMKQIVSAILDAERMPNSLCITKISPTKKNGEDWLQAEPHSNIKHINSFALYYEHPISWTKFGLWLSLLLNSHGNKILRVKGIISIDEKCNPIAVNGVQHMVSDPVEITNLQDRFIGMRIVFITDGISKSSIVESIEKMLELPSGSVLS
ncbi:GTP-binding protein [Vibrio mimicus]